MKRWFRGAFKRRDEGGFTMVELLMTMLILTIVLLGLTALQIGTIKRVTASRRASEATRLAESMLERYRHIAYASILNTGGDWADTKRPDSTTMTNIAVDGVSSGPYSVEEYIDDSTVPLSKIIVIRVTWRPQDPTTQTQFQVAVALRRIQL